MEQQKLRNLGKTTIISASNQKEINDKIELLNILKSNNIPDDLLLDNLGLFIRRQSLSRILLLNKLYKKIINTHGVIMEFGVFFGQNLSLFSSLRGIYEPYNYNRKIIGFDTFEGFPNINSRKDGNHSIIKEGSYSVSKDYEKTLEKILTIHQDNSPINHVKKFEIIKGDATKTIQEYLEKEPQTIISLAFFDFDIYEPTKVCLEKILPRLVKGSILVFDELNCKSFPGETIAYNEVLGLNNYKLNRDKNNPYVSWIEF